MTTQDIQKLSDQQLQDLLYAICRSGKVVIPQYFLTQHIKNLTGLDATNDLMLQVQENFEFDFDLHEMVEEKVQLFSTDEIED